MGTIPGDLTPADDYNGSVIGITAHETPAIVIPNDNNIRSAASLNIATKKLADYVAYLNANSVLISELDTAIGIVADALEAGLATARLRDRIAQCSRLGAFLRSFNYGTNVDNFFGRTGRLFSLTSDNGSKVSYSDDGWQWIDTAGNPTGAFSAICGGSTGQIYLAGNGIAGYSDDNGATWSYPTPIAGGWCYLRFLAGAIWAMHSTGLATVSPGSMSATTGPADIGDYGDIDTDRDTVTCIAGATGISRKAGTGAWTKVSSIENARILFVGDNTWFAAYGSGNIHVLQSQDNGATWENFGEFTGPNQMTIGNMVWTGDALLIATGGIYAGSELWASADGLNWYMADGAFSAGTIRWIANRLVNFVASTEDVLVSSQMPG